MDLLINETDFKATLPLVKSFSFEKLSTDIRRAQLRMIKWILGATLTNTLAAAYVGETTTSEQDDLLEYIHPALAQLAMWMFVDKHNVQIRDNGVQVIEDGEQKAAKEWQIQNLKDSLQQGGYDAIEDLIEFLEENSGIYAWNTGNTRELFISTAAEFQDYVDIKSSRLMYLSLMPILRRIQDQRIKSIISSELYDEIKSQILIDGETSADNQNLMPFIKWAIANLSYADFIIDKSMISDNLGFHLLNNTLSSLASSVTPAEQSRLRARRDYYLEIGENYLQQLATYIYENAETYPLYLDSELYDDEEQPSDQLTNDEDKPIFTLGI